MARLSTWLPTAEANLGVLHLVSVAGRTYKLDIQIVDALLILVVSALMPPERVGGVFQKALWILGFHQTKSHNV